MQKDADAATARQIDVVGARVGGVDAGFEILGVGSLERRVGFGDQPGVLSAQSIEFALCDGWRGARSEPLAERVVVERLFRPPSFVFNGLRWRRDFSIGELLQAIVAHGGTLRVLTAYLRGVPVERMSWEPVANGSVVRLASQPPRLFTKRELP